MSEHRFRLLEIEMVCRGVALRHAKRAALELECHHRELVEQALVRGEPAEQARQSAHEALGSDAVLIERYTSHKELRSWAYRLRAGYVLAPLLGCVGISVAAMLSLMAILVHLHTELQRVRVPAALTHGIDFAVSTFFLWVMPVAVGIAFGALAIRQRVAFRWPLAGILLLCMAAALVNVDLVVTGGSPTGYVSAGIGFSVASLAHELLHAIATAALALIPLGWLRYRTSARRLLAG
jgi:hypothetical protein